MAKKQTLKSLLGGGDGRVQASLDLGKKPLRTTIQAGGQSYTAVQETLTAKQSQMGKLAEALSNLNPALQNSHKGYIAEAEKQKLEFAETFNSLSEEERKALITQKEQALDNTESAINKELRGNYGLNPLASIYAEKLVGGAASTDFAKYAKTEIENYKKEIEKFPIDQRPDQEAYREWANGLVDSFNSTGGEDGGELFQKGSLRYRGLMASTKDLRNELSIELPKTFDDHHKDTVYIPSLVSNLRDAAVDSTITEEARTQKITILLKYLEPLDVADTEKVMSQLADSFKAEDADFARTALTEIARVTTIGTQPMLGSIFMDGLLDTLDDTERAYEREKIDEEIIQLNKFKDVFTPEVDAIFVGRKDEDGMVIEGTGGVDETQNFIKGKIEDISNDENITPSLKRDMLAFLEAELDNVPVKMNRMTNDINDFIDKSEVSTEANTGMRVVETILLEEIEGLREEFPDVNQQNNPFYEQPLGERELLSRFLNDKVGLMVSQERTAYEQGYQNLLERATQLGFKTRQERGTWVMEQLNAKGGLADKFKERLRVKLKAFASQKLQAQKEEVEIAETARKAKEKRDAEDAAARGDKNIYVLRKYQGAYIPDYRLLTSLPAERGEYLIENREKFENTINYWSEANKDNRPKREALPDESLFIKMSTLHRLQGEKQLKGLVNDITGVTFVGKRRYLSQSGQTDELAALHKERISQYQQIKGYTGYNIQEIIDIRQSGDVEGATLAYSSEGVPYDKDHFENSYTNIYIKDLTDNPEKVTELAQLLGITPEELNKSQEDYKKKYFIK